jgi:hypothetical protein
MKARSARGYTVPEIDREPSVGEVQEEPPSGKQPWDANRPPRGRARSLELTPSGAKRLAAAHIAVMGVESSMVEGISASAHRQLAALLAQCARNLESG